MSGAVLRACVCVCAYGANPTELDTCEKDVDCWGDGRGGGEGGRELNLGERSVVQGTEQVKLVNLATLLCVWVCVRVGVFARRFEAENLCYGIICEQ